ncbi:tetratricopeptide repeat protein [Nibribacter ruber]|uniref:Tetratricopeptide repeat protein n=1 Tax=Nibribacter ruber TaxID=2698458 RepID=A0A6P1P2K4_9BACT|nr:tetratricopeptide repeat protein [Nibribacter ruber]QHL88602.1 tetratricopeptide repeat protein [Nibribacter ruber]
MQKVRVLYMLLCALTLSFNAQATKNEGEVGTAIATSKETVRQLTLEIKQNPASALAYANRGVVRLELGDTFGAIKDFTASLKLDPQSVAVLQSRSQAFLQIGAYKEAMQDITSAMASGASPALLYDRAVLKYHTDDYFGALQDLTDVLVATPDHGKALYNRAVILLELNKTQEALTDLESYLKLHPEDQNGLYALSQAQKEAARKGETR